MDQARELADLDDNALRTKVRTSRVQLATTYRPILNALLAADHPQTPEQLAAATALPLDVVKNRLDSITKADARVLGATAEYLPDADVMIDFVETTMGEQITQANLAQSNIVCLRLVDDIVFPRHLSYLKRTLGGHLGVADAVNIQLPDLVIFLREKYLKFVTSQDQGLISRAGRLNERLVRRNLLNLGFVEGTDFRMTGTKGEGDIVVHTTSGARRPITLEIKSYGARERLLRGLENAPEPKIGVGFFNEHSEFNNSRTNDFLGTGALAIYLPPDTYRKVDPAARARVNNLNSAFYRPLTQLSDDLDSYRAIGAAAY